MTKMESLIEETEEGEVDGREGKKRGISTLMEEEEEPRRYAGSRDGQEADTPIHNIPSDSLHS